MSSVALLPPDYGRREELTLLRPDLPRGLLRVAMPRTVQLGISLGVLAPALPADPATRALRGEDLWGAVSQAQITNLDRMLDRHGASVP
jgi:hypothetical protein